MSTSMRSLRLSPLTTRVLLWVIGISVLVFTTVTIATAWQENKRLFHAAQENARQHVDRSLPAISTSLWNFDRPSLDATLTALTQYGSIVRAQVLDRQRGMIAESGRSLDSATPESEWEVPIVTPDGSQMDIGDCRILPRGARCICQECCHTVVLRTSEDHRSCGAVIPCRLRVDYTPHTKLSATGRKLRTWKCCAIDRTPTQASAG